MAENRESILANFQAITAIDDIALAIYHLETSNWNLEAAIHLAIPQDEVAPPPPPTFNTNNVDMLDPTIHSQLFDSASIQNNIDADIPYDYINFPTYNDFTGPSTSSSSFASDRMKNFDAKQQDVTFHVHFNNIVYKVNISNSLTIDDLKARIFEMTEVPVCRQLLKGWLQPTQKEAQKGTTVLKNLNLSRDNNLFLTDMSDEGCTDDNDIVFLSEDPASFKLNVKWLSENQIIPLNFPGTKTILEVKNDLYTITNIPVRYQKWTGWPSHTNNSTRLSDTGISTTHNLELSRDENENKISNNKLIHEIDTDSSAEEFEDASEDLNADDDLFSEAPAQNRMKHLIEDHVDDEIIGCLQFIENYRERYGHGPHFFEGSLEDAMKTACSKQAKDRKLLAIYLHHDRSVLANVFCGQILNNENMIRLLSENFVIYGWDLTCESNKNMFLSSMTACVGDAASLQIRNTPVNQFPAIIVIRKQRSAVEVDNVIHGNVNLDELYIQLMRNSDDYKEQLKVEIREEEERFAREMVKMEQDAAFHESLQADRAKEEAKQQKERMIAHERQRLESERAEIEAKKEAIRKEAESTLPPEPDRSITDGITKIRFRKPTGEFFERRFEVDTKLQILLNFSTANGFPVTDFKIISSFPRRDLTTIDPNETLKSLKLYPQETVMLEERH